jgi:hypothetical protein
MNPAEAVAVSSRAVYMILLTFLIGHFLHGGLQVDAVARSETNQISSRWFIVQQNIFRLSARFFVSLMVFLYIWSSPSTVPTVLGYIGVTLSENMIAVLTLPMNPPVAGMMGFAMDTLLAYIPWLKNQLPPIEYTKTETSVKETTTTVLETHSVQEAVTPQGTSESSSDTKESKVEKP